MPLLSRLCDYCAQVTFDIRKLRELESRDNADKVLRWKLGTAGRIRDCNCPLCRLVSFVLYEQSRTMLEVISSNEEIVIRWDQNRSPGGAFVVNVAHIMICFLANSMMNYQVDKAFWLTPNYGLALDFDVVKGWLHECTSNHGDDCNPVNHGSDCDAIISNKSEHRICDKFAGLRLLRFIDVQRQCIVETRVAYQYVALSYVWGHTMNIRLTTSNLSDMIKPHSLKDLILPRTIQDAIIFVRELGEQYLWCDALCLLQNDPEDISQGVNAMDLIYEKALLTIVAACGHDANSGLPGVRNGSRFMPRYPEEIAPGVQLDVYVELDQAMKHSLYSTRAWTFQEDLLPRRSVYFVDNKVYFRCRSTTLFELFDWGLDGYKSSPETARATLLPGTIHMIVPVKDYETMLLYYTQRALTNQQDALRAMAGIIRRFSGKMKCRFLEGLPTAAFDMFILFRQYRSNLHRRRGFPSYSWTGWRGSQILPQYSHINEFLKNNTWIVWYKRSVGGITSLVWDPLANDSFPYQDLEYVGYRGRSPFHCPCPLSFPTTRTLPTDDITLESTAWTYPILQFWTLSVYFNIKITDSIGSRASIIDRFGNDCGALHLDGLEETTFFNSAGPFEIIALSKAAGQATGRPELEDAPEDYNIMILEWSQGVAERRGIGWINQDSVTQSLPPGPAWKEIFLA